jgi:hypothetical protein
VSSSQIRTLERGFLKVSIKDKAAYVNDSKIIATDIEATNGVIHVIDTVLIPSPRPVTLSPRPVLRTSPFNSPVIAAAWPRPPLDAWLQPGPSLRS